MCWFNINHHTNWKCVKLLNRFIMKKRRHLLAGAITILSFGAFSPLLAQDGLKCGTQIQLNKLYAEDPQLELDQIKLMEQFRDYKVEDGQKRSVIVIPIVFHILHEYGSENITDEQVYDQVRILNEDFRMKNADISQVVPAFQNIKTDSEIEFRLATIDPMGNCTNGIEHIYTNMANYGDDVTKVNQWQRNKYLNVWVVNKFAPSHDPGLLGYAYYPSATTGNGYARDGIVVLSFTIGQTGTGNPGNSRTLTHEIGHYFGLAHVWGNTNQPGVACGEDGVIDTPITKGHFPCKLDDDACSPGIIENVQNYMEYASCARMFTKGQKDLMRYNLQQASGGRNNLYTEENRILTGTMYDVMPEAVCPPQPDFSMDTKLVCVGEKVTFKDASWKSGVTTYEWSFPGTAELTSSLKNPVVTYNSPGFQDVTLTVSNSKGTNTLTMKNAIYVSGNYGEALGPKSETFDANTDFWISQNPTDNHARFQKVSGVGINKSNCYKLNNFKDISNATPNSDDALYYPRLVGAKDHLITNSFDLRSTSNVTISFDYSYGTQASVDSLIEETLRVYSSKDCGQTWVLRKTLKGKDLLTAGYVGNTDYAPSNNNQWKNASFTYIPTATDSKTRFRFEYTASAQSSNLYIDNFNVSGLLSIEEVDNSQSFISVSPNPVAAGSDISVQVDGLTSDIELQIIDVNGVVLSSTSVNAVNGSQIVKIPMNVSKGCYFVNVLNGTKKTAHRVIVF